MTAPESLDLEDVAHVLSDVTGRTIGRVVVDDEKWKAPAVVGGLPEPAADVTLGMFRAARNGEFAATDPTFQSLLARPPISAPTAVEQIVASQQ